jgi:hypothetical protein
MKTKPLFAFLSGVVLMTALSASAKLPLGTTAGNITPRANQGHIPPPPAARIGSQPLSGEKLGDGRINETPHVNHDQWYGHEAPNDPRFYLDKPFEHGRFALSGPAYRYNILRIDPAHHWFWLPGGFYFEVAVWDWPIFADWCWNCGDDFVIYDDPDHIGWYLLYNIHTGVYVHVQYMGGYKTSDDAQRGRRPLDQPVAAI